MKSAEVAAKADAGEGKDEERNGGTSTMSSSHLGGDPAAEKTESAFLGSNSRTIKPWLPRCAASGPGIAICGRVRIP